MRRRFPQGLRWAVAYAVGCHPPTQAQLAAPSEMPVAQAVLQCPPRVVFPDKQIARPKVVIAELNFVGSVRMGLRAGQDRGFAQETKLLGRS